MPGRHPGDRRFIQKSDTGDHAGVAKQVDAPRPERDAPLSRRTAGSNPAAGTSSPSRRSSGPARALTWYVRGSAFDSRRRLHFTRTSGRGEIGSRNRLKSGRVFLELVHVRVVPPGPCAPGSDVHRQHAWPSKPVVRDRGPPPSPRRGRLRKTHKVEQRRGYLAGASSSLALSAPRNMPG